MTLAQYKALTIMIDRDWENPISAAEFAKRMWPDSDMHIKVKNTGNGSCRGKAAWLCGGSYLAKLLNMGYVHRHREYGYYITMKGKSLYEHSKTP